ncbi:DUF4386 family protein [Vibrio hangzhouensis]|uniref:DUF4386 family protein n=1 Tax=Vibrio hangzhouensis TaxID=462991 RepID=A0A1H5W207_9VIBR|nr:DUF4386 family protein [Vibrio hangzhouensis]SEF93525.1 protein of unknown function [Vibrio hangzhouensis]
MNNLQKVAGVSALFEALIYIVAFVYFGAFWAYPSDGTASEKMAYLAENQFSFSMIYFLIYVGFGVLLTVLVVGLYEKLKSTNSPFVKVGSVFGVVWVVLVIASGMLANIGLSHAINLMDLSTEKAFDMWQMISVIIESLGGGNELVGGLWVLLISLAALKAKEFPQGLNYLGLIVGISGIATIYPAEVLTEIFGVTQILWFVWLGISMLSQSDARQVNSVAR